MLPWIVGILTGDIGAVALVCIGIVVFWFLVLFIGGLVVEEVPRIIRQHRR